MGLGEYIKVRTKCKNLYLDIYKGHYATSHSHMNYYIDIAKPKFNYSQAKAVAQTLAESLRTNTNVDTILCLDNTEVIGACLAQKFAASDFFNINSNKEINVVTPEHISGSQLFFRDNTAPMIKGKDVIILAASLVTGFTTKSAIEAVHYYSGNPVGICAIAATESDYLGLPVECIFDTKALPEYENNLSIDCPMCKKGEKINALVNTFGCSML